MKSYSSKQLRNVVLISHEGAGKTSLVEAALFDSGLTARLGRVEDGTTTSDFDLDERERHISLGTSVVPVEWRDCKINFLDTPGYTDFVGELRAAMRVADAALIVVDASSGVEVGTEMDWAYADEFALPRVIVVNKLDRENTDFLATVETVRARLTPHAAPIHLPIGVASTFTGVVNVLTGRTMLYVDGRAQEAALPAELVATRDALRQQLVEAVCETDDVLITRYLDGETIDDAALARALQAAVNLGAIVPVLALSATSNIGLPTLLDAIVDFCPAPTERPHLTDVEGHPLAGELAALVFKTVSDPFGRRSYFRIFNGTLRADSHVWNLERGKEERVPQLFVMRGNHGESVPELATGDIGAVLKLSETLTGDVLTTRDHPVKIGGLTYPEPAFAAAVEPKTRGDLDKLGPALARLTQEDPTLHVRRDGETGQTVLAGMGEMHLQVAVERLHRKYQVDVALGELHVPYRETIKGSARAQGRHKKQTGGHGQFGDVWLTVAPLMRGEGFHFVDKVVGGAVPRNFIPAIEKGIQEALHKGVLAGCPVVDLEVRVDDGSFHPVDSSEMAFKIAADLAVRKALEDAHPLLLEPIMRVEVRVLNACTGDVISDLNAKRGRILGMEPIDDAHTSIQALAPMREMGHYAAALRSITQGRGIYTMRQEGYEEVPQHVAQEIIAGSTVGATPAAGKEHK